MYTIRLTIEANKIILCTIIFNNISLKKSFAITATYRVWYRHDGQSQIDCIPDIPTTKKMTGDEIREDIGSHHITHLFVDESFSHQLCLIASDVEQLEIMILPKSQTLSGYDSWASNNRKIRILYRLDRLNNSEHQISKSLNCNAGASLLNYSISFQKSPLQNWGSGVSITNKTKGS